MGGAKRLFLLSLFMAALVVSWSLVMAADDDDDDRRDPGFPGGRGEGEGGTGRWDPQYGGRPGEKGEGERDPGFPGGRAEGKEGEREPFPGGRGEGGGGSAGPGGDAPQGPEFGPGGGEEGGSGRREGEGAFLLKESRTVVQTEAGHMRVVGGAAAAAGGGGGGMRSLIKSGTLQIGFITMDPRTLFIPQYLDSSLIIFVSKGGARVGHIYNDELVQKDLKTGDIYRIAAGSAFYIINAAGGQRLHIVCSIDTSESIGWNSFQSFFVAGGTYPKSVLSGFGTLTISTALNVSEAAVTELFAGQKHGPIVYLTETHSPIVLAKYLRRTLILNGVALREEEEDGKNEVKWSFRKLLKSMFGSDVKLSKKKKKKVKEDKKLRKSDSKSDEGKAPDAYNIYDRKPDFSNSYGWSIALDENDYAPLKNDDIGIYLVNLTAGAMMAPHINPRATEYGIVKNGAGTIEIVYPNGSLALNAKVTVGDVFWIPRYFPFTQIASRTGPFEFFGFTTSARNNKPQFLVGENSLLSMLKGPEVAAGFGLSEYKLNVISGAQKEKIILPAAAVSPPSEILTGVDDPKEKSGKSCHCDDR